MHFLRKIIEGEYLKSSTEITKRVMISGLPGTKMMIDVPCPPDIKVISFRTCVLDNYPAEISSFLGKPMSWLVQW